MPKIVPLEHPEPLRGYKLQIVQEVLLALLARDDAHGYELQAQLALALGPLASALNPGHVYVTLGRMERSGLITVQRVAQGERPDRKVYALTDAGRVRVREWLEDTTWPKPAPAEFQLKLVAAAAAGLADPVAVVDRQRAQLLLELREAQRAALVQPSASLPALLLEGVVLRLQADLRWLEQCARHWEAVRG